MNDVGTNDLGKIIKQQRIIIPLTLQELTAKSGVSPSHLGRIERGERFPSAHVLRKIARPLDFEEDELLTLAGYLSANSSAVGKREAQRDIANLDPYVARVLASEPAAVQFTVIGILAILKFISERERL